VAAHHTLSYRTEGEASGRSEGDINDVDWEDLRSAWSLYRNSVEVWIRR
jgi:hypothetical protein